jgi:hypothetical protein
MRPVYRTFVLAALCTAFLSAEASAQVTFAGDARFRPRLDLDDRTGDPALGYNTRSVYYQYRLRLDMTGAIGEGYYAKSRLGHNGIAFYARGGQGHPPEAFPIPANTISEEMANRAGVDWMYLYIGRATPTFGWDLGLIPIPGFTNPLWDLHYYPQLMVDVPYLIWNNDGGFGAHAFRRIGPGRLTVYGLLDRDTGSDRDRDDGTVLLDNDDQYTLVANYAFPIGRANLMPMIMKTLPASLDTRPGGVPDPARSGRYNAPLTIGAQLGLPAVGPLTPTIFGGWSTNNVSNSLDLPRAAYDAWLGRFRLTGKWGPGHVLAWADYGRRTDEPLQADGASVRNNFFHTWLNYRFPIHESDRGNFSIGPEWRIIDIGRDDLTLRRRHKIEINFDATFR